MITLTAQQQSLIEVPEGYAAWLPLVAAAAGRAVEAYCSREFDLRSRTETYDGTNSAALPLRVWPVTALTSVVIGGASYPTDQFFTEARFLRWRNGRFTDGAGNVVVTYTAGFLPIPEEVVFATIQTAQAMINAAALDPNALGESTAGYSASFAPEGAGSVPRVAQSLLRPLVARFAR